MERKVLAIASLMCFASLVWSACEPPPGYPSRTSQGHPNVPDGAYNVPGGTAVYSCCNQNYVCGNPNPGYRFTKTAPVYKNASGQPCTDTNGATNDYPTPGVCCNPFPAEP